MELSLNIEKNLRKLSVYSEALKISSKGEIDELHLFTSVDDLARHFNVYFSVKSMRLALHQKWNYVPRLKPFKKLERLKFNFTLESNHSYRLLSGLLENTPILKELALVGYCISSLTIKHPTLELVDLRACEIERKKVKVDKGVKWVLMKEQN